ncbi:MAG: CHAT domain-containing protein [Gammaproteobacteria bacterium]|nr:CHAT domain-containing protein [Gammaproteobacteria bacterium]
MIKFQRSTIMLKYLFVAFIIILLAYSPLSASNKSPASKPSVLDKSIKLYKSGDHHKAETLLTDFIQKANDKTDKSLLYKSYITLSDMYSRQKQYDKKKALLTKLSDKLVLWGYQNSVDFLKVKFLIAQNAAQSGNELFAIEQYTQTLTLAKKVYPPGNLQLIELLLPLSQLHIHRLESQLAENYLAYAETLLQKNLPVNHQSIQAKILQLKGELLFRQGRTNEAVKVYRETLTLREKLLGDEHMATAQTIISLAGALKGVHRFSEAEDLYHRGFVIYEKLVGLEHPFTATILNNLGQLYYLQGRFEESENVLKKSLEIKSRHYTADHIALAETYNHLGYLYYLLERYTDSEFNLNKAIAIWSKPNSSRPRYKASAQTWLGVSLQRKGQSEQALKILHQALTTLQTIYGEFNIATSEAYHQIANILFSSKRYKEAEKYYLYGLKAAQQFASGDWRVEILLHSDLATCYQAQNEIHKALTQSRHAIEGLKLRIKRHSGLRAHSLTTELKSLKRVAINHIDIIYELSQKNKSSELLNESFLAAQISRSTSASRALANMSARFSVNSSELGNKIRQQQDLLQQWQDIDTILSTALFKNESERNLQEEETLRQFADDIKQQIYTHEQQIKAKYPKYDNLVSPSPISIKQIQNTLHQKEALIVYLFGVQKSYLWVIKPDEAALYQLNIGLKELDATVRELRQTLVPRFLEVADMNLIPPLPVDKTYQLFTKILQPAYSSIEDISKLIVVPDAALQSLPLSLLITQQPPKVNTPAEHQKIHWLIKDKSIAAIPAVNSLILLRTLNKAKQSAPQIFIGFGDPSLVEAVRSIKLRSSQQPRKGPKLRGATLRSSKTLRSIIGTNRSAVSVDILAQMPELPETAVELKQISTILGGHKKDIFLRDDATKQTLINQDLDKYRTIQFATHGLMSGDFEGLFEPALVLTPSMDAIDSNNNGLLTASEIAQLNLNADFIVLSACNTAAANGTPGAEGLSGLGKAFFYAGSQAILVTHWEVLSDATVLLTTSIFSYSKEKRLSKPEAHRLAVLDLMNNKENIFYAHPMFWAPFMIIGIE